MKPINQLKHVFVILLVMLFCAHTAYADALRAGVISSREGMLEASYGFGSGFAAEYMQMISQYLGDDVVMIHGTLEDCKKRLESGDIDVIAGVSRSEADGLLLSEIPMGIVGHSYALPVYLAVSPRNTALATRLFDVEQRVAVDYPAVSSYLRNKYFHSYGDQHQLVLSKAEKDYLTRYGTLRVVMMAHNPPFGGIDEHGRPAGIDGRMINRVASDLGLSIEIVPVTSPADALKAMQEGRADVLIGTAQDFGWAKRHGLYVTTPYMRCNYVKIVRRSGSPSSPKVAAVDGYFFTEAFIKQRYPESSIVYCNSSLECMEAVSSHKADVAYVASAVAQHWIFHGGYFDLTADGDSEFSYDVSIAVRGVPDNNMLLSIMNREIDTLPHAFADNVYGNHNDTMHMPWFVALVYNYPLHFFVGSCVAILILLLMYLWYRYDQKKHIRELQHSYHVDYLTGIHNWYWFMETTPKYVEEYLGNETKSGLVYLMRLDIRSGILDEHNRGNMPELVMGVKNAVTAVFPEVRRIAVTGQSGRMLALCAFRSSKDRDEFIRMMPKLLQSCSENETDAYLQTVMVHAGVTEIEPGKNFHQILEEAEGALTRTYMLHQTFGVYDKQLEYEMNVVIRIETNMEKALKNGEFTVWYQPKYDIRTKKLVGAEALVRWVSPDLGFLNPGEFIKIFEKNGFIVKLDNFMLESASRMQIRRRLEGLPIVRISVNQSRAHFLRHDYIKYLKHVMDEFCLKPGDIELELTETAFAFIDSSNQIDEIVDLADKLHDMGYSLSLDDFGSGYSSMGIMSRLPLDVIKIDRTLLPQKSGDTRAENVLRTSISLARSLGMDVICEGIENQFQEKLLLALGCYTGQGFIYARPMPQKDFETFIDEHIRVK